MDNIFAYEIDPVLRVKVVFTVLFLILISILIYKVHTKIKEFDRFFDFHNKATSNITSGIGIENFPFFKDYRLHIAENNLKAIEDYLEIEKSTIIEDKNNLQTIIADISHQVKTPIANIKMINEILLSRDLGKAQSKEFVQSMSGEIEKLDFLLQSMISISFLETGVMKFNIRVLPIYDTILLALNSSMSLINEKEINIQVICSEDLYVKHDQKWTSEAIYNLINNSTKFVDFNGSIVIKAMQEEFYTSISVIDDGQGIEDKNIANIFDKFERRDKENGSGIGLYLTKKIIKEQNGYIDVKSKLNHGSEFSIYLPNE